jgi:hypothetical protein
VSGQEGFTDAFSANMYRLGFGVSPERRMSTQERSELAMERAGTTDKSSRAYKSARRTIERHATEAGQKRGQVNVRFAREVRRRGLRVFCEMEIDPSPGEEEDMRPRTIDETLTGDDMPNTIAALERGDLDAAGAAFKRELLAVYEDEEPPHLPGAQLGEIATLDIDFA